MAFCSTRVFWEVGWICNSTDPILQPLSVMNGLVWSAVSFPGRFMVLKVFKIMFISNFTLLEFFSLCLFTVNIYTYCVHTFVIYIYTLYYIYIGFNGCDDHQDYYIFSRESRTKPSFPTFPHWHPWKGGHTQYIMSIFTDTIFLTSRISSPLFPLIISGFIQSGFNTSSTQIWGGSEIQFDYVFQPGMKTNHHERMMYVFQCFFSQAMWMTQIPLRRKWKNVTYSSGLSFSMFQQGWEFSEVIFSRWPVETYTSPPRKELRLPNKLRQMERMLPVLKWKRILGQISYTLENYHGI